MQLNLKGENKDWIEQAAQYIGIPSEKVLISVNEENKGKVEV